MIRRSELRGSEAGFTVVEAVVASLLLAIAAVAVLGVLDGARRATFRAEQSQVASDIAQRELEELRRKSYSALALTSTPAAQTEANDPRSRVSGSNFALNRNGTDPQAMVVNGGALSGGGTVLGGTVSPGPISFDTGDVTGTIQRFVVWRNDPNCTDSLCSGSQDYKRAVVAVTLDGAEADRQSYVEVQSDVINPEDSVASNPNLPQLGDPTIAQQFWLSDERCQKDGEPAHAALSSHTVRNTFGTNCEAATTNRPDALLTSAPTNIDGTLDFASDLEPTPPDADAGLQYLVPDANGCNINKVELNGTNGFKQRHLWVSQRVNADDPYALTGGATLKLWTRTINDLATAGKLCVILFRRTENQASNGTITSSTDTLLASLTPSYATWPSGQWQELTIPLTFSATTIPEISTSAPFAYQRLGIAIGLEKQGSPSDQLMFQYDNLELESRLEVETTTPLG